MIATIEFPQGPGFVALDCDLWLKVWHEKEPQPILKSHLDHQGRGIVGQYFGGLLDEVEVAILPVLDEQVLGTYPL
jgi:hypothetical protein